MDLMDAFQSIEARNWVITEYEQLSEGDKVTPIINAFGERYRNVSWISHKRGTHYNFVWDTINKYNDSKDNHLVPYQNDWIAGSKAIARDKIGVCMNNGHHWTKSVIIAFVTDEMHC